MESSISFTFYLSISTKEEYNVDKISSLLSIEPTNKWIKGDLIRGNHHRVDSAWEVSSGEIFNLIFREPFLNFIEPFKKHIPLINKVAREDNLLCQVNVVIKIYSNDIMPGIHIDTEILGILSSFNCSIDFDIYDYRKMVV